MTEFIYQKLEWDFFDEAYSSDDSNKDVDWGINNKADKKRFFLTCMKYICRCFWRLQIHILTEFQAAVNNF